MSGSAGRSGRIARVALQDPGLAIRRAEWLLD